jgi:integrase
LPYRELPAFMAELRAQDGLAARALEFAILTAARTGEVTGANPKEFDLRHAVWTIPAARMKAKREHRVPLSSRASEIARESECEFPLSNMAMLMLLRRMGRTDLTVHGFRSTFRDWAAEEANAPRELAEMALAHTIGSNTEAAYRRGDLFERRRELMNAWDKYCNGSDRRSG